MAHPSVAECNGRLGELFSDDVPKGLYPFYLRRCGLAFFPPMLSKTWLCWSKGPLLNNELKSYLDINLIYTSV